MAFTVEVNGVSIRVDTLDEVDTLILRYGKRASRAAGAANNPPELFAGSNGDRRARHKIPGVKVQSNSKVEAAMKLYRSLRVESQTKGLQFLASRGEKGAAAEDLREATGVPDGHRMSGFTSGITRRCEAFGLRPEDVLVVDYLGAVGGDRIYRYRVGPEMLAAIREMEKD